MPKIENPSGIQVPSPLDFATKLTLLETSAWAREIAERDQLLVKGAYIAGVQEGRRTRDKA